MTQRHEEKPMVNLDAYPSDQPWGENREGVPRPPMLLLPKRAQISGRPTGVIELTTARLGLVSTNRDKVLDGYDDPDFGPIEEALGGKGVLPVQVLDFLVDNPELIPEVWKDFAVFFWGALFLAPDGTQEVPFLSYNESDGSWEKIYTTVSEAFYGEVHSAVLVAA